MSISPASSFLSEFTEPWIWLCFDHRHKVWQWQCGKPRSHSLIQIWDQFLTGKLRHRFGKRGTL